MYEDLICLIKFRNDSLDSILEAKFQSSRTKNSIWLFRKKVLLKNSQKTFKNFRKISNNFEQNFEQNLDVENRLDRSPDEYPLEIFDNRRLGCISAERELTGEIFVNKRFLYRSETLSWSDFFFCLEKLFSFVLKSCLSIFRTF